MSIEILRLVFFLSAMLVFSFMEVWWAARPRETRRVKRVSTNIGVLAVGTLLMNGVVLLIPTVAAVGAAQWASIHQLGVFNAMDVPSWMPRWVVFAFCLIFLDFAIWLQHLLTHKIPFLWRFHAIHHSDTHIDTSTALRFHPVEIILSSIYKSGLVICFGVPVLAVVVFEITLNACAIFNHANLKLPDSMDRTLRRVLVTPDMHVIHHSIERKHQNMNYGFCLSIWDQMFRTYYPETVDKIEIKSIGLKSSKMAMPLNFSWVLFHGLRSNDP